MPPVVYNSLCDGDTPTRCARIAGMGNSAGFVCVVLQCGRLSRAVSMCIDLVCVRERVCVCVCVCVWRMALFVRISSYYSVGRWAICLARR